MKFDIDFIELPKSSRQKKITGRIKLNDFEERFDTPLHHWTIDKYREHWLNAIQSIVSGDIDRVCLATEMGEPSKMDVFETWSILRKNQKYRFRNQLIFLDKKARKKFDESKPWLLLPPEEDSEPERKISEWWIEPMALVEYLHRQVQN